jgi:hypothetical protein
MVKEFKTFLYAYIFNFIQIFCRKNIQILLYDHIVCLIDILYVKKTQNDTV